jgi:hypothetical protein
MSTEEAPSESIHNRQSLNTKLYNAVAKLAVAKDELRLKSLRAEEAAHYEGLARAKLIQLQNEFDMLVDEVKKSAPTGTAWDYHVIQNR